MKNKTKRIFELDNIIFILSIILICYAYISHKIENDLFFDIKTGESILKYGIDFKDHFSFIPNLTYLYHHWLYDIFIYYWFNWFSYIGTFFFYVFIFIVFSLLFYNVCKKISSNKPLSFIITLIFITTIAFAFQTRVQSITYLLFFLELILLDGIYKGNKKCLIPLIIDAIIIVNLHMPLWILTIIIFLPFFLEGFISFLCDNNKKINNFIYKYIEIEKPASYKLLFGSYGLLLLTGLLSPHGITPYTFFIKVMLTDGYSVVGIGELKRVYLINNYYSLFLIILLILGLYLKKLKIKFRDILLILGMFVFMLMAVRNIIFFGFIAPLVILRSYYNNNNKITIKIKIINKIKSYLNMRVVKITVLICIIAMIIAGIIIRDFKNYNFYVDENYPVEAVKYIKENLDYKNIRLYNHFNYGSYLEYNDIPVFIDSRAEVYIKDFNGGTDVVNDYKNSFKLQYYKDIFKKYDFDYALVYKSSDVDYLLSIDSDFINIYNDENFVLYEVK